MLLHESLSIPTTLSQKRLKYEEYFLHTPISKQKVGVKTLLTPTLLNHIIMRVLLCRI